MKLFRNILNSVKPHFEKGGKLEKMYPAYDAFETFLFVPDHTSKSGAHIRDSIDLENSKAKTSNLSINVFNFNYKGSDLSTELLFGSYDYFNYNVRVYSQLNDNSSLSNCLQIYQGRLINIQHNDSSLSLEITEKKPWDFLSLPLNKTNTNKTYIPVVYGNYTPETSTVSSPDFVEDANVFPVPVLLLYPAW